MWYFPICSHCALIKLNELIYLLPHIYIFEVKAFEFSFLSNLETHSMLLLLLTYTHHSEKQNWRLISAGDVSGWWHSTRPWDHSLALPWWHISLSRPWPFSQATSISPVSYLTTWIQVQLPQSLCALKHHILGTDCCWARTLQAAQITQPCKCHL